jgi:hypothetical protein
VLINVHIRSPLVECLDTFSMVINTILVQCEPGIAIIDCGSGLFDDFFIAILVSSIAVLQKVLDLFLAMQKCIQEFVESLFERF